MTVPAWRWSSPGNVPATTAGYAWLCPGCAHPVWQGERVYEVARGVWRCRVCAAVSGRRVPA